jgi:hypothetical protein
MRLSSPGEDDDPAPSPSPISPASIAGVPHLAVPLKITARGEPTAARRCACHAMLRQRSSLTESMLSRLFSAVLLVCHLAAKRRNLLLSLLLFFHPGRPRPIAQGFQLRSPWYLDTHEFSYRSFPLLKSRVVTNVPVSYIAELHGMLKVNCEFGLQPTMLTVNTALALPLVGISPSAIG